MRFEEHRDQDDLLNHENKKKHTLKIINIMKLRKIKNEEWIQ